MEENKGLNVTPVIAAATDPAALPGLVPSPPEDSEGKKDKDETTATDAEGSEETESAPEDAEETGAAEGPAGAEEDSEEATADPDGSKDSKGSKDSEDSEAAGADDGDGDSPVFEAADRRGSVTVDSTGVRFQLDDTEAEFAWSEIGAVEYKTSRFGRRLVLSVHDSRGICPAEVEAPDKATLKGWAVDLESALDAYFEETSP
ncbi:hypothetical protein [Streptomyces sp. MAR4 CNX-425]|uniref:hypothetical protein n=1 Tax=Streptomyces sp. MAR4 CNX-425 TaxID=3406343 RepID=UPI003B50632D